jgi:Fe-S oxidoreductase
MPGKEREIRNNFTDRCTACGFCAAMCPAFFHRTPDVSNTEVQKQVRSYLEGGVPERAVKERSRLCNECYKCVTDTCPEGLDPMRINQLLRGLLHKEGIAPRPFIPPSDPQSNERIIAALLTTEEEYRRITTPVVRGKGNVLFFSGCNIYYQPNLLLTALDVLDKIADDWIFLPGMDLCCGNNHDSAGRLADGHDALQELAGSLEDADVETVALWCPTCSARFWHDGLDLPVISFARFVADRLGGVLKKEGTIGNVTLHEACKVAYLDLDTQAPRELLNLVASEPVREMPRHGPETVCCGWSLHQNLPEAGNADWRRRLDEAANTGAKTLATVCHGCQWILDSPDDDPVVRVVNYIRLAGEALGIRHQERCKRLRSLGDTNTIMESLRMEMGESFNRLPFEPERIREAIRSVMESLYWSTA